MDKPDWNQKQAVSIRIVAQLKDMTEEERKAFLLKLLDHLDPMFVQALDFAYGGIPEEEKKEMGLFGRMAKAAGRAAKNEVKRTVRRNARKAARSIRKRLDQRGTSRKTTRSATRRRKSVKRLPKMKRQGGWLW